MTFVFVDTDGEDDEVAQEISRIVGFLLRKGANVNAMAGHIKVTPLHLACRHGLVSSAARQTVIETLFESYFIDVNARTARGQTPLHICAQEGNPIFIRLLLLRGAAVS